MDAHPGSPPPRDEQQLSQAKQAKSTPFSERERRILVAIVEAAIPPGKLLEGAGRPAVEAFERWMTGAQTIAIQTLRGVIWAIELRCIPSRRRPFSSLPLNERMEVLYQWEQSPLYTVRAALRALLSPLKQAHFDRPEMYKPIDCRYEPEPARDEPARWLAQVTNGREVDEDLEIECEVVVIGTGAGGAAAAYELASRGRAVLMLEEGDYHRRSSFRGRSSAAYKTLYRDQGITFALGNISVPVWAGRAVGGSTVINSGTCFRTPDRTLAMWRDRLGLPQDFSPERMGPYFERVEAMLGVAPANPLHIGPIGPLMARGAERLGYKKHGLLRRNAPDCDGQGLCCFGCPTGAKRSTDVSYVPEALKRGAQLITAARVETVDIVAGRARGVTAVLAGRGRGEEEDGRGGDEKGREGKAARKRPTLRVRAEAVVVACGTLMTPLLLRRSGACITSGMLGKNLSIHPASKVCALFDEQIDQWKGIPQGYSIEQFAEEGLMFEGGSLPFEVASVGIPWTGRRFTDLMEQYRHLATFGFMIQDESRGEVRQGMGRSPLILYNLNAADVARMQRGVEVLCEVFQAAGAKRVLPLLAGADEVSTREELERLKRRKIRAGDIEVAAFHPLGTCKIGVDPGNSCVGPDHEAHDVANLYVCDGSAVPSSIGVNPQVTIMAMALRAAEIIDSRLG